MAAFSCPTPSNGMEPTLWHGIETLPVMQMVSA